MIYNLFEPNNCYTDDKHKEMSWNVRIFVYVSANEARGGDSEWTRAVTDHSGQNGRIVPRVFEDFVVVMILLVKLNEGEKQVEGTKGRCLQERERESSKREGQREGQGDRLSLANF